MNGVYKTSFKKGSVMGGAALFFSQIGSLVSAAGGKAEQLSCRISSLGIYLFGVIFQVHFS